jgi:subtilase family serine protease
MNNVSGRLLAGAIVATFALTDCAGGANPLAPPGQVPQTTRTAQPVSVPQNPTATAQPSPAASAQIESIVIAIGGTPAVGSPGTYAVTVRAVDASGAAITGPYEVPIVLTDNDRSGATHLTVTNLPSSTTAVSLVYNGLGGSSLGAFDGATISAGSGSVWAQVAFLQSASTCVTITDIRGYYPCDLQSAYSLPSMTAGSGQTVAVVDAYDDPKAEADLAFYRSEFGLPPCTTSNGCFAKVNQHGVQGSPPPTDEIGWAVEISLDVDMVSAICPNCHIILMEANSDQLSDLQVAVASAARLGATQISNSYGALEFDGENAADPYYHQPGAMVVASAGDGDYGVEYPAASPYVTSVGGTNLTAAANARGWNEFVWNDANIQGTGSGCSIYEPKPPWQKDTGCAKRTDNDVSAVADPYSGVAVYDTMETGESFDGWVVLGGTSVAAPIIAATYALGGASAASLKDGSYSYTHTGDLNDVTTGADGSCAPSALYFCTAEIGYDGPTGNGTPNGTGAFGGPSAPRPAASSVRARRIRRHALQAAAGSPTRRACAVSTQPGVMSCMAILVLTPGY